MSGIVEQRRRRRKEERPGEIVQAALRVFSERGFAAARLDDIAAQADVSKGTLYLYFDTKEALFEAVVRTVVRPLVDRVRAALEGDDPAFPALAARFAAAFSDVAEQSPVGSIAKMVIGESRNFPELARLWHQDVVGPMVALLSRAVANAQARGEVRPGDPRLLAMQVVAPFLIGVLWRETFVPVGAEPLDYEQLAREQLRTLAGGLLLPPPSNGDPR